MLSHALRVTFEPCSPACVTQPPMISSTSPGLDPGTLDDLDLRVAQDLDRLESRQPAVALADRGADGFDDDGLAHS